MAWEKERSLIKFNQVKLAIVFLIGQWRTIVWLIIDETKNENLEGLCLALLQVHKDVIQEFCLSHIGQGS